jgi:hypothetical protein
MNKLYIFLISVLISTTTFCQVTKTDSLKLNEVIIAFQESIEHKDSHKFNELFFDKDIPFIGIMSKATEWSIKKDYPEFEGISVSNHLKFITDICETEEFQKEVFYKIEISHDNSIASISFDYSYHSGVKMIQWGHEKWNLVKVNETWLITNVIYSIHFPEVEPFPLK